MILRKVVALSCFISVAACNPSTSSPQAGLATSDATMAQCMKDTDCKGDRICEKGVCAAPTQQQSVLPAPIEAAPATQARTLANASAKALEDQLACTKSPDPGTAIRAMIKNGLLKKTDNGGDGIPVFAPTAPLTVYGKRVTFVAGWQAESDGSVKKPFRRGPGTAPPHHIAVSVDAKPSDIAYKPREVRDADGAMVGSHSSVEASSLDYSDDGSTITCYGGYE